MYKVITVIYSHKLLPNDNHNTVSQKAHTEYKRVRFHPDVTEFHYFYKRLTLYKSSVRYLNRLIKKFY